ncbi:MAG TPA: COX15/CtaA family protein, partial [Allocoleopsis sp.]
CKVMHSHIGGVVPATLGVLILVIMAWRNSDLNPLLKKLAMISCGLVILQILLGLATFWLHLQVETLTVAHQTVGALLLGTLVAFNVLTWREKNWQFLA